MTQKRMRTADYCDLSNQNFPKVAMGIVNDLMPRRGKKPSRILVGEGWQQATGLAKCVYLW
jgi:hypothetical protein